LQFGFCLPIFSGIGDIHPRTPLLERVDMDELERATLAAEALGYDSIWAADHLILGRDGFILEGWTILTALARVTKRLRLGTIHYANRFRHPAMTAKMAATLDFISDGRLDLFFDPYAGNRPEADAYGLPGFDEDTTLERFEEGIQILQKMWTEESPTFHGKHYQIENAVCNPKPVQRPMPLWIGTSGGGGRANETPPRERSLVQKIAPMIARYADWHNSTPISTSDLAGVLDLLREACAEQGRDYASLGKSLETQILVTETPEQTRRYQELILARNPKYGDWGNLSERYIIGDVETVTRRIRDYADLGVTYFQFWFMDYPSLDGLHLLAHKVMPYFRS
jgi:alkanesulfonate monooxygenase SsuD/methylene tetrahydromethanopterin reductase-like flavin-dependent oxidoreductase (luciferase family)